MTNNQEIETLLKCINKGCNKKFKKSENQEESCEFHNGLPIFHDFKKGWTCCNQIVYSWDEFQNIKGCQKGMHTTKKEQDNGPEFYKSQTVDQAKKGLENVQNIELKSIKDFSKKMEEKKTQEINKTLTPILTADGKFKCGNKGCLKAFTDEDNQEESCDFHSGEPVFHDLKKYWSCCKKETWDWDSFMKLPTCCKGKHVPKMK